MTASRWIPPLALIVALAAAAPGSAGTASVVGGGFTYTAAPSEVNALRVTVVGGGTAQVTERAGNGIVPGAGCTNPEADDTATCTGVTASYNVDLGDLNDS